MPTKVSWLDFKPLAWLCKPVHNISLPKSRQLPASSLSGSKPYTA
jgi:hypothetical protein